MTALRGALRGALRTVCLRIRDGMLEIAEVARAVADWEDPEAGVADALRRYLDG